MKKPSSSVIAIGGALVIGVIATILASVSLGPTQSSAPKELKVAQAATMIEAGKKITPENLKLITLPLEQFPQGAILDLAGLANRTTKVAINPDQIILESMLVPASNGAFLSGDIPYGRRAFTISINEVSGVGGFASPGNYVDVLLSARDSLGQPISKIVVKHVRVMAVAQVRATDDANPRLGSTITLEVSPQEAQELDVARSLGTLSLVLRNRDDQSDIRSDVASKNDLMLSPNYNDQKTIEVIRGNMSGSGPDNAPPSLPSFPSFPGR